MAEDVSPLVVMPEITRVEDRWIVRRGNGHFKSDIRTKQEAIDEAKDLLVTSHQDFVGIVVVNKDHSFNRFIPNDSFWTDYSITDARDPRFPPIVVRP